MGVSSRLCSTDFSIYGFAGLSLTGRSRARSTGHSLAFSTGFTLSTGHHSFGRSTGLALASSFFAQALLSGDVRYAAFSLLCLDSGLAFYF